MPLPHAEEHGKTERMVFMEKKHRNTGVYCKEAYESKVALEALKRAGQSPNLKGNVHEILVRDKINCSPDAILNGKHAVLTKSKTAPVKDLVIMHDNKVAGHMQLKDTASSAGARKTAKQLLSGKYDKTAMYGTDETVEAVAKVSRKAAKRMHSSGVSSATTERIAQRALGTMPSASTLANAAKSGAGVGGAIEMGVQTVTSLRDCMHGEKTAGEAAGDVIVSGIKGATRGAGASIGSSVGAGLTGSLVHTIGMTGMGATFLPAAGAVVAAYGVGKVLDSIFGD